MSTLGSRLKKSREEKRLTQVDISKIFQISNKTWSDYERDRSEPDIEMLLKIADFFEVTLDYLLGRINQNQIDDGKLRNDVILDNDFQFALYGEVKELTEEQKRDILEMVKLFKKHSK